MAQLRRSLLTIMHPTLSDISIDLSAFLEQKEVQNGKHICFQSIEEGGIVFNAGIRNDDRLISVNRHPVEQCCFDDVIEWIRSLSALERKVGANTIQIVAILDIGFKSDGSPYLQFGGFYWNTNVADIEAFIPLVIPDLLTYIYSGKEQNVKLGVNEMMVLYWLSVNKGSVDFDQSRGSNGSFTMYKYIHTSASIPQTTIVILVPTDRPDMCVAATRRGDVILEDFDESRYLGPDPIIGNARFLELAQQDDGRYTIGSTVREDLYITKRENRAVLTETGSLFEIDGPPPNMQARNQGEMEKREEKGEEKTGEKKRGTGEEEGGDKKKKKERKGRKGGSRR
ncbi:uncharacterized protein [Apostichopus japonicus]|uniref:uncharacterized protein isoform X3 n=1 Tax=Stichopus japonicus TaxID=307972 RepID=UPI003AB10B6B